MNATIDTVISVLDQVEKDGCSGKLKGDGNWTRKIMTDLTQKAYDRDLWVHSKPNDVDDTIIEWLYDMAWYAATDEHGNDMDYLELILECEWNRKEVEIKYDLFKVLQGKALNKVFIFQSNRPNQDLEKYSKVVRESKMYSSDENFVLICWNDALGFQNKIL